MAAPTQFLRLNQGNVMLFLSRQLIARFRLQGVCTTNTRSFSGRTGGGEGYDLIVVGGGSGGLACSKEAADLGKKVVVLDYVSPSTQGTKWGLGGTCVNVGCIPKKIMHRASLLREDLGDARIFGWNVPDDVTLNWSQLQSAVQGYVKSLNWGHRVQLQSKHINYLNARGKLKDEHTVTAQYDDGRQVDITGENIVLAVGGRPYLPYDIPGMAEHSLTSDDIFSMTHPPGKTLIVGASYVALECAGFLTGFGYDTTVMVRSIPLRGFDRQMADLVTADMSHKGTRFLHGCRPVLVEKSGKGGVAVTYVGGDGVRHTELYDTILTATGRKPQTSKLGLENTSVGLTKSGKVMGGDGGDSERTSVPHIYAIGDILQDGLELTPVAVKAGKLLARRLFDNSTEQMHYDRVPTTIFTPLEYAFVGITEETAVERHGQDNIEVYHAFYTPLAYTTQNRSSKQCYIKVICEREGNGRVLGFHLTGPDAGEVIQGFATALMSGVRWSHIQSTIGIHPTCAEEIVKLHITKRSGIDPNVTGC